MFKKDQKVFYPRYGVGTIWDIEMISVGEESYLSYVIGFEMKKEKVSLPVARASMLGLRPLSGETTIKKAFQALSHNPSIDNLDWKEQKKELEQLFLKGDLISLGILLRTLFEQHQIRSVGNKEHQLYEASYNFFVDEISLVTSRSVESVEHELATMMLKSH